MYGDRADSAEQLFQYFSTVTVTLATVLLSGSLMWVSHRASLADKEQTRAQQVDTGHKASDIYKDNYSNKENTRGTHITSMILFFFLWNGES